MMKKFNATIVRRGKPINMKKMDRDASWMKHIMEERKRLCVVFKDNLEDIDNCPICMCEISKLFVTIHHYPYHECSNCGHIYMQRQPTADSLIKFYSGKGEDTTIQGETYIGEQRFRERIKQIVLPKVSFCLEYIDPIGKWMDCGCGTGELLSALTSFDIECFGIEMDVDEINFAYEQGLTVYQGDVHSVNKELFDNVQVISMINILEHLKNPSCLLKTLSSYIDVGSYFVIEVPRHPSLSSYNSLVFPELTYRHLYAPDHLHIFTECSMLKMLENSGLEIVAVWEFGQDFKDFVSISAIKNDLAGNEFVDEIMNLWDSLASTIQQSIDDKGFSDTMFIIARKGE